ncbi:MAG: SUMF1/EgtB/PvdO family nonheme iron enzyme [Saprospiraceae bacterium]|nr:SUMF1/EgtB/PvdO family nonheme iron enzyme [Saprospiraceae bacterium]
MKSLNTFLILLIISSTSAMAGNIQVSNISLSGQNTSLNTYQVQFDLIWENSWRTSTLESNWDAAWVVIKYRETPGTTWLHGSVLSGGSIFPSGITGDFAGATGVFIHRDSDGSGDFPGTGIQLQLNYGGTPDDAVLEVCVLAIEMVYIPQGAFVVGDDSPNGDGNFQAGATTNPFSITSEGAITLGGNLSTNLNVLNNGNFPVDDFSSATTQSLPAAFPKGFNAFYTMKYEISQQQYADFLNKLPLSATANRYDADNLGQSGYQISDSGAAPELYTTTTPDRACNFISWADVAAYADWIGLRPMSELEYEKACRGTRPAGADEFAWGSSFIAVNAYNYGNQGTPSEQISNAAVGTGNAIYSVTDLTNNIPRRCGIVAASAVNKTRQETGGSYYGVMEMTGNLWEQTITVGNVEGRQFTGIHGNGVINSSGNATIGTTWPSVTIAPIADGTGVRGGSYTRIAFDITVSARDLVNFDIAGRFSDVGGRLVRTAP